MAKADIGLRETESIDTSWDVIVIEKMLEDYKGGRTLDVEGVAESVLKSGRVIIEEDATGEVKPLKIVDDAYESLPEGYSYAGITYTTILKRLPFASIMVRGTVNEEAAKNSGLPEYPNAVKQALTLVRFKTDKPKIED